MSLPDAMMTPDAEGAWSAAWNLTHEYLAAVNVSTYIVLARNIGTQVQGLCSLQHGSAGLSPAGGTMEDDTRMIVRDRRS
jgi:hypothetical protein